MPLPHRLSLKWENNATYCMCQSESREFDLAAHLSERQQPTPTDLQWYTRWCGMNGEEAAKLRQKHYYPELGFYHTHFHLTVSSVSWQENQILPAIPGGAGDREDRPALNSTKWVVRMVVLRWEKLCHKLKITSPRSPLLPKGQMTSSNKAKHSQKKFHTRPASLCL